MSGKLLAEFLQFRRLQTLSIVTFSHGFVGMAFLLQMALLARFLSVREFGELATALAIATVAEAAIKARGAETALAAFSGAPSERLEPLVRGLLRVDFVWTLLLYAGLSIVVLVADRLRGTDSHLLLLLMLAGFVSFPWGTAKGYITAFLSARAFAPQEIGYAGTSLLLGVALAYWLGAAGFAIGTIVAALVRGVMALRAIGVPWRELFARADGGEALERGALWRFGITGTLRSALVNLVLQIDLLVLSAFGSATSVGLYRAAKTLCSVAQRASQPVWVVLNRPIIAGANATGKDRSRRLVVTAALAFALAGSLLLPPLLLYSGDVMALAFGPDYRESGPLLWWLLPGAWLMYSVTGWSGLFGSVSRQRSVIIGLYLVQLLVFAGVALLADVSMHSVAIALTISQIATSIGFWVVFLRRG